MAWIRQLPSGLWAATVYTPTGRISQTHRLKSAIASWAGDREAEVRRGDWVDPRAGEATVGEWWERCRDARHLEQASKKRDTSHWRVHVGPKWGEVPLGAILKPDISAWVVEMTAAGVGPTTIEGALGVLRALLEQAVDANVIRTNPARKITRPRRDAHVDRILTADEEIDLLANLDEAFPGRVDARLLAELMADTGMRWEEAAAVPPELVDTRRQRIAVAWAMERDGTARPYAKTTAGNRIVTYSDELAPRMAAAKLAARGVLGVFAPRGKEAVPERLVFTTPTGGVVRYTNWRARVWVRGLVRLEAAEPTPRVPGRPGPAPRAVARVPIMDDPQPTPHDLRHTYGSRLADAGVPIHDIMALMGHDDVRSAQRYLHSTEERFDRARRALDNARGRKVDPGTGRTADSDQARRSRHSSS